ncbi:MAG: lysophospholipase [Chloroflexota bacterium]|nr:lysophospholipase [Chloroflexota bacterium]
MAQTVRTREGAFAAADGLRLFERRWLPDGEPRAALAIVHGYAEHGGRYAHVGEALVGRGYAVFACDLRGHGRSDGPRAFVRSFGAYLADLPVFLDRVRTAVPGRPLFLLGHSMGGTIVALAAVAAPPSVEGVLLSGAGLTLAGAPPPLQAAMLALGRIAPRLPLRRLAAADVSRDPEVVRAYEEDPLVYRGRMRAGLIAAMIRAARRIGAGMEDVTLPLLIMHGTADALTEPAGSRELYARARSADRTLKLYEGLYHEILNEPERAQVIDDIARWLDARSSAR